MSVETLYLRLPPALLELHVGAMQAVSIEAILLLVVSVCVFAVLRIAWDFRAAVANIQFVQC